MIIITIWTLKPTVKSDLNQFKSVNLSPKEIKSTIDQGPSMDKTPLKRM